MTEEKKKDEGVLNFKIIFLPDDDFNLFKTMLGKKIDTYDVLDKAKIDNFMTTVCTAVYVPLKHKDFLYEKAKAGKAL